MHAFAQSARAGLSIIVTACAMLALSANAQPPGGPGGPGAGPGGGRGAMPGGPGGPGGRGGAMPGGRGGAMPGGRGGAPQGAISNLPTTPTAVTLPTMSAKVTGPGAMFDSAPSHAPGLDLKHFGYITEEYFVSGTADGRPYTTRLTLRRPDDGSYSGLVLAESMHSSGAAHAFEFTAAYVMDSGHVAAEILTVAPTRLQQFNAERYASLNVSNGQENEILAQVGALLKSANGPLGTPPRKMVLSGSSMSSGTMFNYLPAHRVLRTPDMKNIYDGYMPTSNATMSNVEIDVPMIQLPTLHEFENSSPTKQDSDEPNAQYRLYEIAGIGHVDSRDNVRLIPNPCAMPTSQFPSQAYMSLGLHHLFRWVDEGIPAPRAERVLRDFDRGNDDSMTKRDTHGNVMGGIRSPYVDVPFASYKPTIAAADPPIANPAQWIRENQGGAATMCRLAAYEETFSAEKLRELYGSKRNFLRAFEARLNELEAQGWSLPLYHDLIMADARAVDF